MSDKERLFVASLLPGTGPPDLEFSSDEEEDGSGPKPPQQKPSADTSTGADGQSSTGQRRASRGSAGSSSSGIFSRGVAWALDAELLVEETASHSQPQPQSPSRLSAPATTTAAVTTAQPGRAPQPAAPAATVASPAGPTHDRDYGWHSPEPDPQLAHFLSPAAAPELASSAAAAASAAAPRTDVQAYLPAPALLLPDPFSAGAPSGSGSSPAPAKGAPAATATRGRHHQTADPVARGKVTQAGQAAAAQIAPPSAPATAPTAQQPLSSRATTTSNGSDKGSVGHLAAWAGQPSAVPADAAHMASSPARVRIDLRRSLDNSATAAPPASPRTEAVVRQDLIPQPRLSPSAARAMAARLGSASPRASRGSSGSMATDAEKASAVTAGADPGASDDQSDDEDGDGDDDFRQQRALLRRNMASRADGSTTASTVRSYSAVTASPSGRAERPQVARMHRERPAGTSALTQSKAQPAVVQPANAPAKATPALRSAAESTQPVASSAAASSSKLPAVDEAPPASATPRASAAGLPLPLDTSAARETTTYAAAARLAQQSPAQPSPRRMSYVPEPLSTEASAAAAAISKLQPQPKLVYHQLSSHTAPIGCAISTEAAAGSTSNSKAAVRLTIDVSLADCEAALHLGILLFFLQHVASADAAASAKPFRTVGLIQRQTTKGRPSLRVALTVLSNDGGSDAHPALTSLFANVYLAQLQEQIGGAETSLPGLVSADRNLAQLCTVVPLEEAEPWWHGIATHSSLWRLSAADEQLTSTGTAAHPPGWETVTCVVASAGLHHAAFLTRLAREIYNHMFVLEGVRLWFVEPGMVPVALTEPCPLLPEFSAAPLPVLALALGGHDACRRWETVQGPRDPKLARRTDPHSLQAEFGGEERQPLLCDATLRSSSQAEHLARWFGPRLPSTAAVASAAADRSEVLVRFVATSRETFVIEADDELAAVKRILRAAESLGLQLVAAGRARAETRFVLGLQGIGLDIIKPALIRHFQAVAAEVVPAARVGVSSTAAEELVSAPLRSLVDQRLNARRSNPASRRSSGVEAGQAMAVPLLPSVAVLAISAPSAAGLARLLQDLGAADPALMVLGCKVLPAVDNMQAREVTPYEVGDRRWKASVAAISQSPLAVVVVGGLEALQRAASILKEAHLETASSSPTESDAYRLVSLFFHDRELSSPSCIVGPDLPAPASVALLPWMRLHNFETTTLALVKPDGLPGLGRTLQALSRHGLSVEHAELLEMPRTAAQDLVRSSPSQFQTAAEAHVDHLAGGACVALQARGLDAVGLWRRMVGEVDPQQAKTANAFSLRGSLGGDIVRNKFHASESHAAAERELKLMDGILHWAEHIKHAPAACVDRTPRPPVETAALVEVVCLALAPAMVQGRLAWTAVVEHAERQGFAVVGLRMATLSREAAEAYASIGSRPAATVARLMTAANPASLLSKDSELRAAPTVFVALQRVNAVACAKELLTGSGSSSLSKVGAMVSEAWEVDVFASSSVARARQELALLLRWLSPACLWRIEKTASK